ncbi:hypothetical protein [Vibrio sp. 10N.286.55.E10]|nr:hypothetical protein [Vibrio sp. 10N.286.55.E10]
MKFWTPQRLIVAEPKTEFFCDYYYLSILAEIRKGERRFAIC